MTTRYKYAHHDFPRVFLSLQPDKRPSAPREELVTPAGTSLRNDARAPSAGPPRTHCQAFPARAEHVSEARKFLAVALANCQVAEDAVLCLSELASNSVIHSASRQPGGTFTVRAEIRHGDHVRIEVHDAGGPWTGRAHSDGRPHGLDIVRALAADCGVSGDALTGRTVWARLDWPAPQHRPPDADRSAGTARSLPSPQGPNQATNGRNPHD